MRTSLILRVVRGYFVGENGHLIFFEKIFKKTVDIFQIIVYTIYQFIIIYGGRAVWSARWTHSPKVAGSNPVSRIHQRA